MQHDQYTMDAMDVEYTSASSGKTTRLAELPITYLRNIANKMAREGGEPAMLDAVTAVIAAKDAEYEENKRLEQAGLEARA